MDFVIPFLEIHIPSNPFLYWSAIAVGFFALSVAFNITKQLILPIDPSKPPLVFHFVPIIGSAISYGIDPYKFFFSCREKYGNVFTFILLGRRVTVALGPEGNNFIFNAKLAHVSAEEAYTHLTTPVFGTEVVYDCPNHRLMEQKKFVKFGLSTEHFKRYVDIIASEVDDYMKNHLLPANKKSNRASAIDVASEITICTASATLQGKEVRASLDKTFAQLYHDLDGGFTPLNFVFPNLPLPSYRRRDKAQVSMRNFFLDILKRRRESGEVPDDDMLEALQGQTYKDGVQLSDKEIAHIMIALLMAGQHTSAATGSWILLHLAERTDIQQALYEEQLANYGNPDGTFRPLDYNTLQTPLINAVIRETLRMHAPLHSLLRKVLSDLPVPSTLSRASEYVIRKGEYVMAAPGVAQLDPRFWRSPESFDPYRWVTGEAKEEEAGGEDVDFGFGAVSTGANSHYLPFGAGRHRCIGEQFAYLQLATIIATLVRKYKMQLVGHNVPKSDFTTMVVMPKKPCSIEICKRE